LATASGKAAELWNGDFAVVHVGLFDFTGAFREKRLDAPAFRAALEMGWRFIDALPFWMHDETCFAEKGFEDEADYSGPSAAVSPRSILKRVAEKADSLGFEARAGSRTRPSSSARTGRLCARRTGAISHPPCRTTAAGRALRLQRPASTDRRGQRLYARGQTGGPHRC